MIWNTSTGLCFRNENQPFYVKPHPRWCHTSEVKTFPTYVKMECGLKSVCSFSYCATPLILLARVNVFQSTTNLFKLHLFCNSFWLGSWSSVSERCLNVNEEMCMTWLRWFDYDMNVHWYICRGAYMGSYIETHSLRFI